MRRSIAVFLTVAALSVVSVRMAGAAPPITYNWTGFYIGTQVGGGWYGNQGIRTNNDAAPNFPLGFADSVNHGHGLLGGGYAGFNYQINQFVLGIEGDYSWASLTGNSVDAGLVVGPTQTINFRIDHANWIATATGRLGYAVNNWMFFGKGGWAWAGFTRASTVFNPAGVNVSNGTAVDTRGGWTIGTGVEWAFASHWSAKLEYDYVHFGTTSAIFVNTSTSTGIPVPSLGAFNSYLSMVKLGAAYRF